MSDVISSCILSDLTPRSSRLGLELRCLCIPVGMTLSMKDLGAKETRQQLFQPGRRGARLAKSNTGFMPKLWTKTAFLESQSRIFQMY